MLSTSRSLAVRIAAPALLGAAGGVCAQAPADAAAGEFFEKRVRPVLVERCQRCHGPRRQKSGLRLDSRARVLRGGERGPAVVPGDPAHSRLVAAIGYGDPDLQMPPKSKLPAAAIADLTAWVKMGAPWPGGHGELPADAGAEPAFDVARRLREHGSWAFAPPRDAAAPAVRDASWPTVDLDRFVLARLESAGLAPAPRAARRALIRRASFDLLGLPPSPAEVEAFANDRSPDAWPRLVDRLLASPHFGERWARHWLDLVRYAESKGHEFDFTIPNAWQYRDYVIRAFNADVPYDQFVVEHVAGDLMPSPRRHPTKGFDESVLGTGFWHLGEEGHSPVDVRADQAGRIDNEIDVFSKTFLGLTVACARCHDHKFDAISTRDYYALSGYVLSSSYRQVRFDSHLQNARVAEQLEALRAERGPAVVHAVAETLERGLTGTASCMLGAGEVLGGARGVGDVAAERGLDPERLAAWVDEVRRARDDDSHPLHAWARMTEPGADGPAVRHELLARLEAQGCAAEATPGLVVADFGATAEPWLQDGVSFGCGPRRSGEPRFGGDPRRPIEGVHTRDAAYQDPVWGGLALAPGTEREPGSINWVQSGRTLRTATFELRAEALFYLVKGRGNAVAIIDGHRLIHGPLHGAAVKRWDDGGWRWIEHRLAEYRGHRVHVEMSPADDVHGGFAVAKIVQADEPPGAVTSPPRWLARVLDAPACGDLTGLAAAYDEVLRDAVARFGAGEIAGDDDAVGQAELVDWLLRHPALLGEADAAAARVLDAAAAPFAARRAELVADIVATSRTAPALLDGSGVDEHVLVRGDPRSPGELVPRRSLEAFGGDAAVGPGSGRLRLARELTRGDNPLVARVLVNRVWHHLLGRGLVASVDNFGAMGHEPSHPDLLDHLAVRFARDGWSVKRLIRSILLSSTYRMASSREPEAERLDPHNLLLHRAPVRRLQGEILRDAMLAVSGRLDGTMFGKSVPTHLTPLQQGRGRPPSGPLDGAGRRSIYLSVRRNFLSSMFQVFDYPVPFTSRGRRDVTNVPGQALVLMNSPFVVEQAASWAKRVLAEVSGDRGRVARLYVEAFARPPDTAEIDAALAFVARQAEAYGDDAGEKAWTDLCHVLFNVVEFVYVP